MDSITQVDARRASYAVQLDKSGYKVVEVRGHDWRDLATGLTHDEAEVMRGRLVSAACRIGQA